MSTSTMDRQRSGLPCHDGAVDARVRGELLALVYSDQRMSLLAAWVFAVAITLLLVLGEHRTILWVWLGGMSVTLVLRYVALRAYANAGPAQREPVVWERRFFVGATATAAFWGLIGWYAFPIASPSLRGVVVLLIGGVVAAASRTVASQLRAYFVYAVVSALPLITRLFVGDYAHGFLLGGFAALYVMLMLGLGRSFRDMMAKTFRLRFENEELALRLERDIVARRTAEEALRASEERLQFAYYALDHAQDLVAIVASDGALLQANEALRRHAGRTAEELARTKAWDAVFALSAVEFARRWSETKQNGTATFETEVLNRDGERKTVEVNASYIEFNGREAVCLIARDVSPRRAAEEEKLRLVQQLQETQRLESLGVLAGGIAHDFNNLLTAILGNASLARETLDDKASADEMLGQIERAANQAGGLCRQMLAYAGKSQLVMQPLELSALVADTVKLVEMTIGRRARLELNLGDGLPRVIGDASQLRQILINLAHNAAEAVSGRDGRIVITTSRVRIDGARIAAAQIRAELSEGDGIALTVEDNGEGMDAATQARIFEPFFTTKFTGRGLGLAAVLGIVRSHHALLTVESAPGVGSKFQLVLPAVSVAAPAPVKAPGQRATRYVGRALVVDDETPVRDVAQLVLRHLGFQVESAADGDAAIALANENPGRFTFVLVDMTMPGLDGIMTVRELRRRGVSAPAVLMSGFAEQQMRKQAGAEDIAEFLQKPFDFETLRGKVDAALLVRV